MIRTVGGVAWRAVWCALVLAALLPAAHGWALGGPENVVLVVNAQSWASLRLANEYVQLRRIPPANVVYLDGIADIERMNVETFRQKILLPVLQAIESRGLARQVDAVVYSADFPTTIDVRADVGDRKLPQVLTPDAAINGLTYLYPFVMRKDIRYLDFQANAYARRLQSVSTDTPWTDAQRQRYAEALAKMNEVQRRQRTRNQPRPAEKPSEGAKDKSDGAKEKNDDAKPKPDGVKENEKPEPAKENAAADEQAKDRTELSAARDVLVALREDHPRSSDLLYNLACLEALLDRADDAVKTLTAAVEHGWFDHRHAQSDSDLRGLRERADFQQLIEKMKNVQPTLQQLRAFRGLYGWSPQGDPQHPQNAPRYLISTMLSYTAGRGLAVSEALQQLKRSVAADFTDPSGTVYFPHNGDVRSTTREWGFRPAAAALEKIGIRAVVEPGVLPQGKSDVAGAVIGTAGFEWPKSGSTILPGAIVEHLTSFGGMLGQDAGQTPLIEFIRHGAAGASGTVTEPYAIQAKFPTPFIQWSYANGYTLGEAFYQSVSGPYQLLIVGDVLCRPWGNPGRVDVEGWPQDGMAQGMLRLTPTFTALPNGKPAEAPAKKADVAPGLEPGPAVFELYVDGRLVAVADEGKTLEFDGQKLVDGPHEFTVLGQRELPQAAVGRATKILTARRAADAFKLIGPANGEVRWDQAVEIELQLPEATELKLMQNSRELGKIAGARGTVKIPPAALGAGPVRLTAVGRLAESEMVSTPLDFAVVAPPMLAAQTLPADQQLHDGLLLRVAEQPASVVANTRPDWLGKSGVTKPAPWILEGWFQVPANDVYQFQLEGQVDGVRVTVDDQPLTWPRGSNFWTLPTSLAAGWHRVTFATTEGNEVTKLGIRFGGRGTRWLEGAVFRHGK